MLSRRTSGNENRAGLTGTKPADTFAVLMALFKISQGVECRFGATLAYLITQGNFLFAFQSSKLLDLNNRQNKPKLQ